MAARRLVGFIGLDELSLEMATLLVRSGFHVQAYEVSELMIDGFLKLGGAKCACHKEAVRDAAAMIILMSSADQIDDLFFGKDGVVKGLHKDAVIILRSAMSPAYIQKLEEHFTEETRTTVLVDAHVSKGVSKALNGKIMVTTSGRPEAMAKAHPVLSAMSEQLYIFEGEVGAGSKFRMVNSLLEGIHLVVSMEAMFLAVQSGLHPWIVYDIISNAAGSSWIFANMVPHMLRGDHTRCGSPNTSAENLGAVLDMAKSLTFPLPLLAMAHQQLLYGSSGKYDNDDESTLVKFWEKVLGVNIRDVSNAESYSPELLANQFVTTSYTVKRIGFIGLGAMGFGMATHLLKSNFCVLGYDVYEPTLARFANAGGLIRTTPEEVSKGGYSKDDQLERIRPYMNLKGQVSFKIPGMGGWLRDV